MSRPPAWIRSFLDRNSAERSRFYPRVALIAVTLILSGIVLGEIDGVLRAMHVAGRPAYGMEVFPGPFTEWDFEHRTDVVDEAFGVWEQHGARLDEIGLPHASGGDLIIDHALIDTLFFLPAYLLLLGLLIWRCLRHVGTQLPPGSRLFGAEDNPGNDPAGPAARLLYKTTPGVLFQRFATHS